ncbi:MAG: zinc ribbon domain-containing protein, partial [Gemmataceae bacterium]|nr:zinc ribbon domain-containing protein [Gemmataceae bacterium]
TYDSECRGCAHRFEEWQPFTAAHLTAWPRCGKPRLTRLFGSGGAIIFKGSGFYETDYRRPESQRPKGSTASKEPSSVSSPADGKTVEAGSGATGSDSTASQANSD